MSNSLRIDLFCHVVDNYGDIGVSWRFARQLAAEHPFSVRIIVDAMDVFNRINPQVDPSKDVQRIENVEILRWSDTALDTHYGDAADAVVEMFACTLPGLVVERMKKKKSVWIDFEYLCAEAWIEECHAKPSFHPATGLEKTLFFPGFTERTGGLIRERHVVPESRTFSSDVVAQNLWRQSHGIPLKEDGITDISLFCYPDAPLEYLCEDFQAQSKRVRLFVPPWVASDKVAKITGGNFGRGDSWTAGPLSLHGIPFLTHPDYDRLLATCDFNFIRGEDSWIRAIWAAKPFIWQIYPQDEDYHMVKLRAFLKRYEQGLAQPDAETLADFHTMWNLGGRDGRTGPRKWDSLLQFLPVLTPHALAWSDKQAELDDSATSLARFIRTQIDKQTLQATG